MVFAIGYSRNLNFSIHVDDSELSDCDIEGYNSITGEIVDGTSIFGIGIAFPQVRIGCYYVICIISHII